MSLSNQDKNTNTVRLSSSDGEEFEVAESTAALSLTIKFAVDNGLGGDSVIPLPEVNGKTLAKILEYCEEKTAGGAGKTKAEKKKFDQKFVDVDQAMLYDLLQATNYLEIDGLLDILIQRVADMIKNKTPEQIRKKFNIKNDFTLEEEEQMKKDNAWAFG